MDKMTEELGFPGDNSWSEKAEAIKGAINKELWNEKTGRYDYFTDKFGGCDYQEGMGQSFAIMFGIADREKTEKIFNNVYVSSAGIPCVWPVFPRYETPDGKGYGRHSGTVWPHIQGFWAYAAAGNRRSKIFKHELEKLAEHASRDSHFAEIYHPVTGKMYGGRQEWLEQGIIEWKSCVRQTWSATAYIRMVLMGLIGMEFMPGGITFKPLMPEGYHTLRLSGLCYRDMVLNICIAGTGRTIKEFSINGKQTKAIIDSNIKGNVEIDIVMDDSEDGLNE